VSTPVYLNGTLQTALPAWSVGWVGSNALLANLFVVGPGIQEDYVYSQADIYNTSGTQTGSLKMLPQLYAVQVIPPATAGAAASSAYSPSYNAVYSLTTGATVWTSGSPYSGVASELTHYVGTVSGADIVFQSQNLILAEPY
jgi:hypothetical protein